MSFAAATCRSAKHRRHAARAAAKRRDKGRPARGSAAPFYLAFHAFDVASVVAPTPQITQGSASVISGVGGSRSEEHTTELQSLMRISYAVFCLKKQQK